MVMLALMRLGEQAYGVPIGREIEERLEEKGLVTSSLGDPTAERGGRAKRFFHLTSHGLGEVRETQSVLVKLWSGLPELKGGLA